MFRIYIYFILLCFIYFTPLFGQKHHLKLVGEIRNEKNEPIVARVSLEELHLVRVSDKFGKFTFTGLNSGSYTLFITAPGYQANTQVVELKEDTSVVDIVLKASDLETAVINVTATSRVHDILTSPEAVSVVEGRQLKRKRGAAVMEAIADTPGVTNITSGSSNAKPVIRGLSGQRVLTMTDGVRQEDQQWGDDHTVEVDSFDIDKIEVIRGPSSVLYGSDALGGAINIIRSKAPLPGESKDLLAGSYSWNSFFNNKQDAQSLELYGAGKYVGYRVHGDFRKASNITTPDGRLPNTGFRTGNLSGSLSTQGEWGHSYVDYFHRDQTQDFYDNPLTNPWSQTYQKLRHDKAHWHTLFLFHWFNVETDIGYQRNHRREVPGKNLYVSYYAQGLNPNNPNDYATLLDVAYRPNRQGLDLFLDTTTEEVKIHHRAIGPVKGTIGVSGMQQRNRTLGNDALIPNYSYTNIAAFWFEEWKVTRSLTISGGARRDQRVMDLAENSIVGNRAFTKDWAANTGTLGVVWRFARAFSVVVNSSKGFRAPTAFELTSNGIHEGTGQYDIGNQNLRPEYSQNVEGILRYATNKVRAEISVYKNYIQNYIFAQRTGNNYDPLSGLPIYSYTQGNALIRGGEFFVEAQVAKWLVWTAGVDWIHGQNVKAVQPLPLIPANRGRTGARFLFDEWFPKWKPYVSAGIHYVAAQKRVIEYITPTPEYTLDDAGFGWEIPGMASEGQSATFDIIGKNLGNTRYVDFLSRYRAYALNPGINIEFKLTIPFTLLRGE